MTFLLLRLWTSQVWFGIPSSSSLLDLSGLVWHSFYFFASGPNRFGFCILFSLLDLTGLVWHSFFFFASGPLRFGLSFLLFASRPNRFGLAFLLLLRLWTSQVWFGIPSISSLLDLSGLVWHSFFFFASGPLRFGLVFFLLLF